MRSAPVMAEPKSFSTILRRVRAHSVHPTRAVQCPDAIDRSIAIAAAAAALRDALHTMADNAVWKAVKPYVNGGLSGLASTCVIQPLDSASIARCDGMRRGAGGLEWMGL